MEPARQSSDPPGRTAVVAGATGLIGGRLLALLDAAPDYARVIALVRRPLRQPGRRVESIAVDFDDLSGQLADVRGSARRPLDVFCTLGTTIKAAGSQAAFRRVDFDLVLQLAHWAKAAGARRFIVVSALGAGARSATFYNRVKGEMENALHALAFPVVVLRPSLLAGSRDEFRLGERIALAVTAPLRSLISASLRPVQAADVAASMLLAARDDQSPPLIESAQMHGAARHLSQIKRGAETH